ncbi:MAG: 30S ribosomal protein S12 methylthiotransferase RimO [Spirochaetes bacterium]|jgi:ribosomal protein S12 methylthiotransferase|nr:30S ribosomal protein S12 methylthiotransferase RimO [Spirochaetota bacterium]
MSSKTFYIENLGCAKNQVDADIMVHALQAEGWRHVESPEADSAILVNTCSFIREAKEESISSILALREQYPDATVIATGCLAQRYGSELAEDLREVDGVFGNRAPAQIARYLREELPAGNRLLVPEDRGLDAERTNRFSYPGSAYVKIAEGCDTRCAFCAIPEIRGPLTSRRISDIAREVDVLLADGAQEIILVAQDLTTFGRDRGDGREHLMALLEELAQRSGDFWVRLLYLYPERFPRELLELCRRDARFVPYFDIPFQHASREVLRGMSRPGDGTRFLSLVREIRDAVPQAVIRSTIMLGYPGETDEAFGELHDFIREAELDWAGFFVYSPEEDTPAYRSRKIGPRVAKSVARRRKSLLEETQGQITRRRIDRFIGRRLPVLIEENVAGEELAIGRCYAQAPEVDGLVVVRTEGSARSTETAAHSTVPVQPGKVVEVLITRRNGIDLEGVPVA